MNKYLNELVSKIKSGEFELIETTLSNKELDSKAVQTTYGFVVKSKNLHPQKEDYKPNKATDQEAL